MKKAFCLLLVILCVGHYTLHGFHVSGSSHFASQMKGFGEGCKQFGEGMAESFGLNPPGYHYDAAVFNNADSPINAEIRRLSKYQGMMVKRYSFKNQIIDPSDNSDLGNHNIYVGVDLPGNNYQIVNMMPAYKKGGTYYYNVYQTTSGTQSEFVGLNKTTTSEFLGSIYNNLSTSEKMSFQYADENFTVTLDHNCYNMLTSNATIANSIRPPSGTRSFTFGTAGSLTINSKGLASKVSGATSAKSSTESQPVQVHYEIIDSEGKPNVITNGYNPGNFTQATNQRLRSITPVRCLVWNKSIADVQEEKGVLADSTPIEPLGRSVWVAYSTPGWSNSTYSITDTVVASIPSGKCLQFFFMRPSVDGQKLKSSDLLAIEKQLTPSKKFNKENTISTLGVQLNPVDIYKSITTMTPETACASLFIVSLNIDATDTASAQKFFDKLFGLNAETKIPLPDLSTLKIPSTPPSINTPSMEEMLTEGIKSSLLSKKLVTNAGELVDTETGVSGYLLSHDIFTPYGNGAGPYYYSVEPPQAMLNPIVSNLIPNINKKLSATQADITKLQTEVASWVTLASQQKTYAKALKAVYSKVLAYLQKNGISSLFQEKDGKKVFTWKGNLALNKIVSGPNGVLNAPVHWLTGINEYVANGPVMPTKKDKTTGKQVVAWADNDNFVDLAGNKPTYLPSRAVSGSSSSSSS